MSGLGKYDSLREFLSLHKEEEVMLTLRQIEIIINNKLPQSAYMHYAWWSGPDYHPHVRTWTDIDWKAEVHVEGNKIAWVKFTFLK